MYGTRDTLTREDELRWYAVFTLPQNEHSAARHLEMHRIESFLPTYETVHVWKNRQRKTIVAPLFPTYLFVHISSRERASVLGTPGVVQILGTRQQSIPLDDSEIKFLRTSCEMKRVKPFRELIVGDPVRIRSGALKGLRGVLVRRNNNLRFVMALEMINQSAAIEVEGSHLEPA